MSVKNMPIFFRLRLNSSQHASSIKIFLLFFTISLLSYWRVLAQTHIIGWDTFDVGYPQFQFIVDCIHKGELPLYNHYELGGYPIFENFFSFSHFTILDWPFLLLAQIFNPLSIFHFQFIIFSALSGYWFYRYLNRISFIKNNTVIGVVGGLAYMLYFCVSFSGQASFLYASTMLAYLLGIFVSQASQTKNTGKILIALLVLVSLMIKSYFYLIACYFIVAAVLILCLEKYSYRGLFKITLAVILACCLYLVISIPLVNHLNTITSDLTGNFISPEPRLRSSIPDERLYYKNVITAFLAVFDGNIFHKSIWTIGLSPLIFLLFTYNMAIRVSKRVISRIDIILIATIFIFLSAAGQGWPGKYLVEHLPLLSSNRWGYLSLYPVQILILVFCLRWEAENRNLYTNKTMLCYSGISGILIFIIGILLNPANILIMACLFFLLLLLPIAYAMNSTRMYIVTLAFIIIIPLLSIVFKIDPLSVLTFVKNHDIYNEVQTRTKDVTITQDIRSPGNTGDYDFSNKNWLLKKIPTLDGYNNFVHPIFWYLKGHPEANRFVYYVEQKITPPGSSNISDNQYLEDQSSAILSVLRKTSMEQTNTVSILLTPSSVKIKTSEYGGNFLIIQNMEPFFLKKAPVASSLFLNLPGRMAQIWLPPNSEAVFQYDLKRLYNIGIYFLTIVFVVVFNIFTFIYNRRNMYLRP